MKAVYIQQFGGPEVLKYGDLPDPSAGPGQIVVDTFAASVNGADWKVRAGHYGQPKFPLVLGRDFSGVVRALDRVTGGVLVGFGSGAHRPHRFVFGRGLVEAEIR